MDVYVIIYFFVVFIFLRGIFKDLKLLLFTILSIAIVYAYTLYNRKNSSSDLNVNKGSNINKALVHNYGNIVVEKEPLQKDTVRKLEYFKRELTQLNLDNQTKIELISNIKKFLEIYHNYDIYDYKKNYLDDLVSQKTKIYNMISSINITYSTKDSDVFNLFKTVEEFLEGYISKFKNGNTYNFLEHPSGYEKNEFDLFL